MSREVDVVSVGMSEWPAAVLDDPEETMLDLADRLVARRSLMDRGEATWLGLLVEFDRDQLWALDGQLSCVDWLMWRLRMSRGTAFEKLRVAHELRRRPQIGQALEQGTISYCAARAITRLDRPDPEVDAALVQLAAAGTVRDLEHAVRHYQLCAQQDRLPDVAWLERRGLRVRRGSNGLGTIEATLDELELDELQVALAAFMDESDPTGAGDPVDESSREDGPAADRDDDNTPGATPVDESSREDGPAARPERVPAWQRRADALMDLVRTAMAHRDEAERPTGADRYLVHLVTETGAGTATHLDGTPLHPAHAARAACDATTVRHLVDHHGGLLDLGRRTRVWSTSQRRAVAVRDGGTCRFPGCPRTRCDLHHLHPWSAGGATDLDNSLMICTRHHTLIHQGYTTTGNANGEVTFHRPDGSPLGTTRPVTRHWQIAA